MHRILSAIFTQRCRLLMLSCASFQNATCASPLMRASMLAPFADSMITAMNGSVSMSPRRSCCAMSPSSFSSLCLAIVSLLLVLQGCSSATFTVINKCSFTIWPGILGTPRVDPTGFELRQGGSRSIQVPTGWSGRIWGRTGCSFDSSTGQGSCTTADCNSGQIECNGAAANPPATLAEFTLGSLGSQSLDYYDVSLVDGYNLPMIVEAKGGMAGACATTGCVEDINRKCPAELRVDGGDACRSACDAFGKPEYCCQGAFASPATCKPSAYSDVFKSACPKSYSYAYDDATSTFTCAAAGYTITFCPNSPSLKSARDPYSDAGGAIGTAIGSDAEAFPESWLADMATGKSTRSSASSFVLHLIVIFIIQNSFDFQVISYAAPKKSVICHRQAVELVKETVARLNYT